MADHQTNRERSWGEEPLTRGDMVAGFATWLILDMLWAIARRIWGL